MRVGVVALAAALPVAAPALAAASPTPPAKPHPTTTTTKPGKSSTAFAKLVVKPDSIGHVNVEPGGSTTFTAAKNGQQLAVGDTVQTDATGKAEIDYSDTAYTRLDVNTTFTIKKLTDSQGNRQVEGSVDIGRTYNRTAALTQSESFKQDGGGSTAAVAGTAFAVSCTSPTSCTFTGVVDNVILTGAGGQTRTLNPLTECVSTNGVPCAAPTELTPDELALIQWIHDNVLQDFNDRGIGNGIFQPFAGTVQVSGAVVQSFTPSTPNQGFTPQVPPAPQPLVDRAKPVCVYGVTGPCTPQGSMTTIDDSALAFQLNGGTDQNGTQGFNYQFTQLNLTLGSLVDSSSASVTTSQQYGPSEKFTYTPLDATGHDVGTDSFQYQVVDKATQTPSPSPPASVQISVTSDPAPPPGDD